MKISPILIYLLIGLMSMASALCQEDRDSILNPENLFSSSELEELNSIVNNFDTALMDLYSEESLLEAYKAYAEEIRLNVIQGQQLAYKVEIESVFQNIIETDIANQIWWFDTSSQESKRVNINCNGKYLKYLQKVGDIYPFIHDYAQELLKFKDLGAAHILNAFVMNSRNFDFSDRNIRLIFAIHYVTSYNL